MSGLAQAGAVLLGGTLAKSQTLHGGSLSQLMRITLTDGREAIVKSGPAPNSEAEMLTAIAATGAPAPEVLGIDETALVISILPDDGTLPRAWPSLGRALAIFHAATGERYGWHNDYAFASVQIVNSWTNDWPRFWAENRLLVNMQHVPSAIGRRIEALVNDIQNRLPARPRASLLHGDLWGGNVVVSGDTVSGLIDPACYHGHDEVDIAMLTLFDHPSRDFYDAYGPAEPGRDERLPIYRLWPALVHLRLFGTGYRAMVEGNLSAAGV